MTATLPGARRVDIAGLRERYELTQADLAEWLHVDKRTIRRWEQGDATPSPMALAHIRQLTRELEQDEPATARADPQRRGEHAPAAARVAHGGERARGLEASLMPQRRLPSL